MTQHRRGPPRTERSLSGETLKRDAARADYPACEDAVFRILYGVPVTEAVALACRALRGALDEGDPDAPLAAWLDAMRADVAGWLAGGAVVPAGLVDSSGEGFAVEGLEALRLAAAHPDDAFTVADACAVALGWSVSAAADEGFERTLRPLRSPDGDVGEEALDRAGEAMSAARLRQWLRIAAWVAAQGVTEHPDHPHPHLLERHAARRKEFSHQAGPPGRRRPEGTMADHQQLVVLFPAGRPAREAVRIVDAAVTEAGGAMEEHCDLLLEATDEVPDPPAEPVDDPAAALDRVAAWPTYGSVAYWMPEAMVDVFFHGIPHGETLQAVVVSVPEGAYDRGGRETRERYHALGRRLHGELGAVRTVMGWGLLGHGLRLGKEIERLARGEFAGAYPDLDLRGEG
jgi:hypothetical protein